MLERETKPTENNKHFRESLRGWVGADHPDGWILLLGSAIQLSVESSQNVFVCQELVYSEDSVMFTALIPPQNKIKFPRDQKSKLLNHNNHPSLFFSGNVFFQTFEIGWFEPCVWRAATPSLKMCWKFTSKSRESRVTDELRRAATSSRPPSARWLVLEGEEGVFHYLSRSPPTSLQAPHPLHNPVSHWFL